MPPKSLIRLVYQTQAWSIFYKERYKPHLQFNQNRSCNNSFRVEICDRLQTLFYKLKGILCDFFIFTLEQIIVLNTYCTYNKPIPKISHVKTLQNLC